MSRFERKPNVLSALLPGSTAMTKRILERMKDAYMTDAAKELKKIAEQTNGRLISIDPKTGDLVGLVDGVDSENDTGLDVDFSNIYDSIKVDMNDTLADVSEGLEAAPLVLKCRSSRADRPGSLGDMAELSEVSGFRNSIAYLFFNSAVERSAAQAHGLQTMIAYQEPVSKTIHILTTSADVTFGTAGQRQAFGNRTELSLTAMSPEGGTLRARQFENNRVLDADAPLRYRPLEGLTSGFTLNLPPADQRSLKDQMRRRLTLSGVETNDQKAANDVDSPARAYGLTA